MADTKWVNLEPLLTSYTFIVWGRQTNVKDAIQISSKMPELILLGEIKVTL